MAVETIWVVAESFDGKALPVTLELLSAARQRAGTIAAFTWGAGISGATQHMVGMKGAKNIIAINKDQEAPIFSVADLGVVGDVHKMMPKLIESLQSRS